MPKTKKPAYDIRNYTRTLVSPDGSRRVLYFGEKRKNDAFYRFDLRDAEGNVLSRSRKFEFATYEAAIAAIDAKVAETIAKGYVLSTRGRSVVPASDFEIPDLRAVEAEAEAAKREAAEAAERAERLAAEAEAAKAEAAKREDEAIDAIAKRNFRREKARKSA